MKFTRKEFIEKIAPYAKEDMIKTKVPASLTIAQAILESADGNSTLAREANNLFGIKGIGTAGSVEMVTYEYINGVRTKIKAKFRKYNNWGESVSDHSNLFLNGVSWNRSLYHGVLGKDGITAAREVAKAGYATDPNYADKLIKLIHDNDLLKYDINDLTKEFFVEEITKLNARIYVMENKLKEIPAPDWFKAEFSDDLNLLNKQSGTLDFWRAYAISLRSIKFYLNNLKENLDRGKI